MHGRLQEEGRHRDGALRRARKAAEVEPRELQGGTDEGTRQQITGGLR